MTKGTQYAEHFPARPLPAVSKVGESIIVMSDVSNVLEKSENGGAFVPMSGGPASSSALVTFTGIVAAGETLLIGTPVSLEDVGGVGRLFMVNSQRGKRCVGISTGAFAAGTVATIATVGLQAVEDDVWDEQAPATIPIVTDVGKPVYLGSQVGEPLSIVRPGNGEAIIVGTVRTGGAGNVVIAVEILHTTIRTLARFTANDAALPVAAPATAIVVNDHGLIAFDDTVNEQCDFTGYWPDWAAKPVGLEIEIYWAAESAIVGDVNWNLRFETLQFGSSISVDNFLAVFAGASTVDGTLGDLSRTIVSASGGQTGSVFGGRGFRLRVIRDAVDGNDTMVGDARLLFVAIRQLTPP